MSEINLAIEKKMVSNLKAELSKAKEAARLSREAAEAAVVASYKCCQNKEIKDKRR